ncbi:helix-turn-helix domain-containing protein, partial [Enterococcus faecalis]
MILRMNGVAISKIAKDYNITRQTIYRIKKEIHELEIN